MGQCMSKSNIIYVLMVQQKKFQKEDNFMELEWKWVTEPEMKCQLIGNGMAAKWQWNGNGIVTGR